MLLAHTFRSLCTGKKQRKERKRGREGGRERSGKRDRGREREMNEREREREVVKVDYGMLELIVSRSF